MNRLNLDLAAVSRPDRCVRAALLLALSLGLVVLLLAPSALAQTPAPTDTAAVSVPDEELRMLVESSDRILVVELGAVDTLYTDCRLFTGYRYDVIDVVKGEAPPTEERWLGDVLYIPDDDDDCVATGYDMDVEGLDIDGVIDKRRRVVLLYRRDNHFAVLPTMSLSQVYTVLRGAP